MHGKDEWVVASESLVLENGDYEVVREVEPGEAVFITNDGELFSKQCATAATLAPCALEYVYLARPDSVMNGISVYESRLRMGDRLADTIAKHVPMDKIDVVMPIPDSSRPRRDGGRRKLGIEYREGFYKNRYVGRTFIMPGQGRVRKSERPSEAERDVDRVPGQERAPHRRLDRARDHFEGDHPDGAGCRGRPR